MLKAAARRSSDLARSVEHTVVSFRNSIVSSGVHRS